MKYIDFDFLRTFDFNIGGLLNNWNFDLQTAIATLFASPIVFGIIATFKKYLKVWVAYITDGLMFQISKVVNSQLAGRFALKRYAQLRLGEESRYLHVPSSRDIKLEVDRAFVTLSMEHQGSEKKHYDHTDLLSVGSRIRVIGDPGSGKSSLIKRLMRDACFQAIDDPKLACLPILLELKSLDIHNVPDDKELGVWLFEKLRSDTSNINVYRMQDCFDSYVLDRGLLVLLDGLDEVSTQQYPRVRDAINKLSAHLAQQSENNRIVLTMRTQFHQQVKDQYRDNFGQALFLRPFSPTDIYEFLTRWPFDQNRRMNMARIYKELTDRPSLREMCGNPLVLAMYVAEDQAQGHIVAPDSRTEFYRKVTEELIIKRRQKQTGAAPAHMKLREQRELILGRLAYNHMLNADQPANALSWNDAIRITQDVMNCSDQEAEILFREIARETGLITEERPRETLRFIHLTFCEFLAALEAVQGQSDGWETLIGTHRSFLQNTESNLHSRLIEVIPFACGLMQRKARKAALSDIVRLNDNDLLARSFLETKAYEHASWTYFVDTQKNVLLSTSETSWDAEWLRRLHLFNVVVRDANQCATHSTRITTAIDLDDFYKALVQKQNTSLSTLLTAYAAQDAAAAFRLAEVSNLDLATNFPEIIIANCDQPPFLALVLEQATREEKRTSLWAPLLAEAALRSRVVRIQLHFSEPLEAWRKQISVAPIASQWADGDMFNENLFTQSMTLALLPNATRVSCCSILELVSKLPAPGSFRKEALFGKLSALFFFIALASFFLVQIGSESFLAAIGLFFNELKDNFYVLYLASTFGLFVMLLFSYFNGLRWVSLRTAYHRTFSVSGAFLENRLIDVLYGIPQDYSATPFKSKTFLILFSTIPLEVFGIVNSRWIGKELKNKFIELNEAISAIK